MEQHTICVVEDDALTAKLLETTLTSLGYAISMHCINYNTAIEYLQHHKPSLVLLDVYLDDAPQGLAIAKLLKQKDIPYIFITAIADQALLAQVKILNPSTLLVKPISRLSLFSAIEIALANHSKELLSFEQQSSSSSAVMIKDGYTYHKINYAEICYLTSEQNYVAFHLKDKRKCMMRSTLNEIAQKMPSDHFLKISRSVIINTAYIQKLDTEHVYIDGVSFKVSSEMHQKILHVLKHILV